MKCPTCDSPAPHLHPAVAVEGEVELCVDDYHLSQTASNKPKYVAAVLDKRALAKLKGSHDGR